MRERVHSDLAPDGPGASTSSRLFLFAMVVALTAGAGAAALIVARGGDHTQRSGAASATAAGCVLTQSEYGYPDRYLTQPVQYTKHPPLPTSGWRDPDEFVRFNVLFHSVFHGFVVVEYRTNVSPQTLRRLRWWVQLHAGNRVTSIPARPDVPFVVDVAKWGHELRCRSEAALTTDKLDRFLRLR